MIKLPVFNSEGKEQESLTLPSEIFGRAVNKDILYQALLMYRASFRQGNASTKERGAVSGGGKKPWKQKGTGRARAGSTRSPLWKKGGVVFGPHPRDFGYDVPKKVRVAALRESLNAKFQDKDLLCFEDLKEPLNKTKEFAAILKKLSVTAKTIILLDGSDPTIERVSRNIGFLSLKRSQDLNAYEILQHKKLLVTKTAFKNLLERITK